MRKDPVLVLVMKGSNRKDLTPVLKALVALDRLVLLNRLVSSIAEEHASAKEPACNKNCASEEEPVNDVEHTNDKETASDEERASDNVAVLQQDIAETCNETSIIFNLSDLRCITNSLDFNTSERMSCNGSKHISLHNKHMPDKNIRYQMFDFASRVTKYSRLLGRLGRKRSSIV